MPQMLRGTECNTVVLGKRPCYLQRAWFHEKLGVDAPGKFAGSETAISRLKRIE